MWFRLAEGGSNEIYSCLSLVCRTSGDVDGRLMYSTNELDRRKSPTDKPIRFVSLRMFYVQRIDSSNTLSHTHMSQRISLGCKIYVGASELCGNLFMYYLILRQFTCYVTVSFEIALKFPSETRTMDTNQKKMVLLSEQILCINSGGTQSILTITATDGRGA